MNNYKTGTIINFDSSEDNLLPKGIQVINISIQAPSGSKFYINNNKHPIIIGPTGIFSWEIKQQNTYIYNIKIEETLPDNSSIIVYEYIEKEE